MVGFANGFFQLLFLVHLCILNKRYRKPKGQSKMDNLEKLEIRVITKLPNSEQSYKGKVKPHKYINRQNQSTTGKL